MSSFLRSVHTLTAPLASARASSTGRPCLEFIKSLREKISRALATAIVFSLAGAGARSADPAIEARLDAYLNPYVAAHDFSGVVLIARGDSVLAHKAYGMADFTRDVPNKPDTKFRTASVSKTFTATAIIMLREQGKLKLTDALSQFLPDFPNGQGITIEHLLDHRSGVGTFDDPEVSEKNLPTAELVRRIAKRPPLFAPGIKEVYSNEGYVLLAAIIEKLSGLEYDQFLQERIFEPLGMRDSGTVRIGRTVPNHALGHVPGPGPKGVSSLGYEESGRPGAGSIYSTTADLYRWMKAIRGQRLSHYDSFPDAYGWGKRTYGGRHLIEQAGLNEGFNSYIAIYRDEPVFIAFLSNVQTGLFNRVALDLNAIVFGGEFSKPPSVRPVAITEEKLAEYIGRYEASSIPVPLHLVRRDGALHIQWGRYRAVRPLIPTGPDEFFYRSEYVAIRFQRNASGKIENAVWSAGSGEPIRFARK